MSSMKSCVVALLLAITLGACGGGGDSTTGTPPATAPTPTDPVPPSDPIPPVDPTPPADPASAPDAHTSSLGAISSAYDGLPKTDPQADAAALLAVVRALPDVQEASLTEPTTVSLTFKDGITTIISTQSPLSSSATAPAPTAIPAAAASRSTAPLAVPRQSPLAQRLPSGRQVFLIDSAAKDIGGADFVTQINNLSGYFKDAGYGVLTSADVNPGVYRSIKNASVLHLLSHGAIGQHAGLRMLALTTSLKADVALNRATYANEINSGEMGYFVVPEPHEFSSTVRFGVYLYITQQFVLKNMTFTEGSLVFLNGCSTFGANSPEATDMRNAFIAKGARSVIGWSNVVNYKYAIDSAMYLFDRLLGADAYAPYKMAPAASPNRPFPLDDVLREMRTHKRDPSIDWDARDLTLAQSTFFANWRTYRYAAELMIQKNSSNDNISLVPSISSIYLENGADRLTIGGNFGPEPMGQQYSITIGGVDMRQLAKWTDTSIVISNLPRSGGGASGEVRVNVSGLRSNPAMINQWRGVKLTNYSPADGGSGRGDNTARVITTCTVNLRGSTDAFRSAPNVAPDLNAIVDEAVIQDGVCSYDANGTYNASTYTLTYGLAGSPDLPWLAAENRDAAALLPRWAYATGLFQHVNQTSGMQISMIGRVYASDGGGVRGMQVRKSDGAVSYPPPVGIHETASSSELRFDGSDALLSGATQQTLNYLIWSGVQGLHYKDSAHAR